MNYGYVNNGQVEKIGLPKTWKMKDGLDVSGFDLLPPDILIQEGWLPMVDEPPAYDQATEYIRASGYQVEGNQITQLYIIEPIPAPDMAVLKDQKLAELNAATVKALSQMPYKGMIIELGAKVDTNILKFRAIGHLAPDRSVQWQALDGTFGPDDICTFTVTLEERPDLPDSVTIDQLDMDITMYEYGVSAQKGAKLAAIREAQTPEVLNAIVVDYHG